MSQKSKVSGDCSVWSLEWADRQILWLGKSPSPERGAVLITLIKNGWAASGEIFESVGTKLFKSP